jgi:phosphatidate cytidylyltransferase
MLTRIISGIIGAAVLIGVLLLPPYVLAVVVAAAAIIGLFEFAQAMKHKEIHIDLVVSAIAAVAIVGKAYGSTLSRELFPVLSHVFANVLDLQYLNALLYIIIVYFFCRIIFEKGRFRMEDMAYTLLGILYIPFLLAFIVSTRNLNRGFEFVWLIFIGAMMTDIFAYFSGVFLGKTKIIPHISPKKTVEGSIGGALGCMLIMILYGALVINRAGVEPVSLVHFAILGLLCGIVSQLGDWAASAIKRNTGIKDYGNLIPGHGGIMDRADSVLFVAPLIYIYVSLFMC